MQYSLQIRGISHCSHSLPSKRPNKSEWWPRLSFCIKASIFHKNKVLQVWNKAFILGGTVPLGGQMSSNAIDTVLSYSKLTSWTDICWHQSDSTRYSYYTISDGNNTSESIKPTVWLPGLYQLNNSNMCITPVTLTHNHRPAERRLASLHVFSPQLARIALLSFFTCQLRRIFVPKPAFTQ